jgi:hypothetical protein
MVKSLEFIYLIHVFMLDNSYIDKEHAINGREMYRILKEKAHDYHEWMGNKKWDIYFLLALAGTWNINDQENIDCLNEGRRYIIQPVCDSEIIPEDPETYYSANYWLWNGDKKGFPFSGGISRDRIEMNNLNCPITKVSSLSDIKNDWDLWSYVDTWLEENWRINKRNAR